MKLTKNFSDTEFQCKCGCGAYIKNEALLIALEDVRKHFDNPVSINSSTRCKKHNDSEGGAEFSWHLSGHAADIVVANTPCSAVYDYLNKCSYSGLIGLGSYNTFTHIDTRGKRARW